MNDQPLSSRADMPAQTAWAYDHPYLFAVLLTLSQLGLAGLVLGVAPTALPGWDPIQLRIIATCTMAVVAAALLQIFQLWGPAGFNRPSQWRENWAGWIAVLICAAPLGLGVDLPPAGEVADLTWKMIVNSFAEEAIFRGLAIAFLLQRGGVRAVLITAFLFGSLHFMRLMFGADFGATLVQVIFASAYGIFLGALWLGTRTIWWPIIIHTLTNLLPSFASADLEGMTGMAFSFGSAIAGLILAAILLRRASSKPATRPRTGRK